MPATTAYQAGIETTQTIISYGIESAWAVVPAVQFQRIRYTSETLSGSKSRTRPTEIQSTGEVVQAVTTQEMASGDISFALSFGTFDDFLSGAVNSDWQPAQAIAGIAGDTTITAGAQPVLSSTLSTKFANIAVGQWIRLLGFTNTPNNGFFRVSAKADNAHLTLAGPNAATVVTETPAGAAAQVRASTVKNGTQFKSFYIQQSFSPSLFLVYPGSFVSAASLSGSTGQFFTGSFTFMSQVELNTTADASTGSAVAAPTGRVHDSAASFGGMLINEAAVNAALDSFTINLSQTGAAAEYGMGTAASLGQVMGLLEVKGTVKLYFKDFSIYSKFKTEAQGAIEFITRDPAGNAYVITVLNGALMNPKVDAGGPSKPVYVTMDIEGNPQTGGGTIQIDRLPAV